MAFILIVLQTDLIQKDFNPKAYMYCPRNLNSEKPLFQTVFILNGFDPIWSEQFLVWKVVSSKFWIKTFWIKNYLD